MVIHEKRFTYQSDGLHLVQDLGDFWERETGFAIPLGAIAARKGLDLPLLTAAVRAKPALGLRPRRRSLRPMPPSTPKT